MLKRLLFFAYGLTCYLIFLGTFLYAIAFVGGFGVSHTLDAPLQTSLLRAVSVDCALLAVFALQQGRELHQPGWRLRSQDIDDFIASRAPAELAERLQHRVVGFLAAISLHALATRERMLREIGDAVETITAQRPLLIVFEDLHWVDHATVDLLSALARRRSPARMMLIGSSRPVDLVDHPLNALNRDLLVHQLCLEIALQPVSEIDVADFLAGESAGAVLEPGESGSPSLGR